MGPWKDAGDLSLWNSGFLNCNNCKFCTLIAFMKALSYIYPFLIMLQTSEISSMYYESGWERIICHSSNVKANVSIMRQVTLAIATNSKPFHLTGMNYIVISLPISVKVNIVLFYLNCKIHTIRAEKNTHNIVFFINLKDATDITI